MTLGSCHSQGGGNLYTVGLRPHQDEIPAFAGMTNID